MFCLSRSHSLFFFAHDTSASRIDIGIMLYYILRMAVNVLLAFTTHTMPFIRVNEVRSTLTDLLS